MVRLIFCQTTLRINLDSTGENNVYFPAKIRTLDILGVPSLSTDYYDPTTLAISDLL